MLGLAPAHLGLGEGDPVLSRRPEELEDSGTRDGSKRKRGAVSRGQKVCVSWGLPRPGQGSLLPGPRGSDLGSRDLTHPCVWSVPSLRVRPDGRCLPIVKAQKQTLKRGCPVVILMPWPVAARCCGFCNPQEVSSQPSLSPLLLSSLESKEEALYPPPPAPAPSFIF